MIFKAYYSYIYYGIKGVDFHEKHHFYTLIFPLWGSIHPLISNPNCNPNCNPNPIF